MTSIPGPRSRISAAALMVAAGLTLVLSGCGGASSGGARPEGSAAGVVYAPDVLVLERDEGERLLRSVGEDAWVLVFEGDTEKLRGLRRGQTLLIRDVLARRVIATHVDGSRVALLTEPAALTDIIADGHLQFHYPARFTPPGVRAAAPPAPLRRAAGWLVPPVHAASDVGAPVWETVTRKVNQWECTFAVTPAENRLNIRLTLKSAYESLEVLIEADGYIENFDVEGDILVQQSRTERLELAVKQLTGAFDFRWIVRHDVAQRLLESETIQLPAALKLPLAPWLGGIPLSLDLTAAIMIRPAFSTSHQASTGSVRIEFGGDPGFVVGGGSIDPGGDLEAAMELVENVNISPRAGLGLVVAFAAPRIDLSIGMSSIMPGLGPYLDQGKMADEFAELLAYAAFGERGRDLVRTAGIGKAVGDVSSTTAAAWFALNSTVGVFRSSEASLLPCERQWLIVAGTVGVKAKLLGEKTETAPREILKRERTFVNPDTPFCRSAG
jgi:hypothetical protein